MSKYQVQMSRIPSFRGCLDFLSNMYVTPIFYYGKQYKSTEHAYASMKCLNEIDAEKVRLAQTPQNAKLLARSFLLKPNWNDIKLHVMEDLLRIKFSNERLKEMLLETGDIEIKELCSWNDTYWGIYRGIGDNNLGKLLMKIRKELSNA